MTSSSHGPHRDPTGLSFTEEMRGRLAAGETDPATGARVGGAALVHLTIGIADVEAFVADPAHLADVDGWITADALGGRLDVHRGWFSLFVPGPAPASRRMLYRLHLTGGDGRPRTLVGRKEVRDDAGTDLWDDTTTLFTRVLDGHVGAPAPDDDREDAAVTAAGVLRISETALVEQLTTFRTTGPDGPAAMLHFGRFFLGRLWDVYGRPQE